MAFAEKRGKGKDGRIHYRGRYKLPNGRYGSVSRDDEGKPFYTKRSAQDYAHGLEVDVQRRTFINPRDGRITVEEWATSWLEAIDVAPLTLKEYKFRLKNQILPEWGTIAIGDLSPLALAAWEKRLRRQLSKNSVDGIRSTFRTMLDDAVIEKIRADNPLPSRKSGRRGRYKPKTKNEKVIATPRQALLIARNGLIMRELNEYALVLTAAYTGLRIGEIAGLHRDQVSLVHNGEGPRIHSEQQSQYVDGEFTEIDNKYGSARGLIIPKFLAELLQKLMDLRPKSSWVFTAPKGGRLLHGGDWYTDTFNPMVEGRAPRGVVRGAKARPGLRPVLGVSGLTPHGLRHSHKAWLDEGNLPRVAVEARMGHEIPGVEGIYSHVTLAMELAIADHLQLLWEKSLRPVVDRREFGPYPALRPPRQKRSPKILPEAA